MIEAMEATFGDLKSYSSPGNGLAPVPYSIRINDQYRLCFVWTEQGPDLRLAQFFGTSEGFWMNLPWRWDLYHARQTEAEALSTIRRFRMPGVAE